MCVKSSHSSKCGENALNFLTWGFQMYLLTTRHLFLEWMKFDWMKSNYTHFSSAKLPNGKKKRLQLSNRLNQKSNIWWKKHWVSLIFLDFRNAAIFIGVIFISNWILVGFISMYIVTSIFSKSIASKSLKFSARLSRVLVARFVSIQGRYFDCFLLCLVDCANINTSNVRR